MNWRKQLEGNFCHGSKIKLNPDSDFKEWNADIRRRYMEDIDKIYTVEEFNAGDIKIKEDGHVVSISFLKEFFICV